MFRANALIGGWGERVRATTPPEPGNRFIGFVRSYNIYIIYILYYILYLCGSFLLKAFKTMMYEVHCSMTATLKHLKSHKLQPIEFLCWDHDT